VLSTPWRWLCGGESPIEGSLLIILIVGHSTHGALFLSVNGSKKQALWPRDGSHRISLGQNAISESFVVGSLKTERASPRA
jgi:hypothetical protein